MEEWLRSGVAVATPLIAIAALITSIWVSQRVKCKREFEILLEENRREATKREAAIQALFDRSDRNFEALLARSDELFRRSAGVAERVVRSETRLETLEVARPPRAADPSAPAAGETEAVGAQDVPVERHPE